MNHRLGHHVVVVEHEHELAPLDRPPHLTVDRHVVDEVGVGGVEALDADVLEADVLAGEHLGELLVDAQRLFDVRRLVEEGESLPQLIVIDGGKGQLSAALKSLEKLGLRGKISIIGIAKRLEEIYFPEDPIPLYLDKKSETLRVIQQLRNEAHRFGITFHRNKRSKAAINSVLEGIEGVGQKTAQQLLRKFKSVKRIRESSLEDLAAVVGPSKARKVYESLRE